MFFSVPFFVCITHVFPDFPGPVTRYGPCFLYFNFRPSPFDRFLDYHNLFTSCNWFFIQTIVMAEFSPFLRADNFFNDLLGDFGQFGDEFAFSTRGSTSPSLRSDCRVGLSESKGMKGFIPITSKNGDSPAVEFGNVLYTPTAQSKVSSKSTAFVSATFAIVSFSVQL